MLKEQEVKDTLRDLINEYGSTHTAICTYSDLNGDPLCIIGHVIYRLEPDAFEVLKDINLHVSGLVDQEYIKVESDKLRLDLLALQRIQDAGKPWGYAVNEVYPEVVK